MKRVMVGNYTYETDLDLKVGDKVVLHLIVVSTQ